MKDVSELTIEDVISDIFTTYAIKKKRKDIIAFYKERYQLDLFGENSTGGIDAPSVEKKIDEILKVDKSQKYPHLSFANSFYRKSKRKSVSIDPAVSIDTNYMGKGGECLVMGELLFRGYNVNSMMVDEGIDLVASKDNVFYYIQVKTKSVVEQNRMYFQIKQERFDSFLGTQIRYILVARCKVRGEDRTIYFMFTNNDIQRFMYNGVIPTPSGVSTVLSVKIDYDVDTGRAFIYDGKNREDVSFFMNNFNL